MCGCCGLYLLPQFHHQVLARVAKGTSVGLAAAAVPLYICKTVSTKISRRIFLFQVYISLGSFIAVCYTYIWGTKIKQPIEYLWATEAIWGVILLIISLLVPKLLKTGQSIAQVCPKASLRAQFSSHEGLSSIPNTKAEPKAWELFSKRFWLIALRGAQVYTSTMFTCVPALEPLFGEIAMGIGNSGKATNELQLLQYATVTAFALVLIILCDFRRKDCFIFGMVLLAATYSAVCAIYKIYGSWFSNPVFERQASGYPASILLSALMFSFCVFHTFVLPVSAAYSIELVQYLPTAVAISTSISWIARAVTVTGTRYILGALKEWTFAIVACLCLLAAIIVLFFPETYNTQLSAQYILPESPDIEQEETKSAREFSTGVGLLNPDHLPIYSREMVFQNFIPLLKKPGDFTSELSSSDFGMKEPEVVRHQNLISGLRSALRMVTARSRFSDSSLTRGHDPETGFLDSLEMSLGWPNMK